MPEGTRAGQSTEPPSEQAQASVKPPYRTAWPWVLCVIGLDYLSTLAYQPSVAFGAAGRLAPLVTVLVAGVTLFLALPIYLYIAGRSPHGGGTTALLERSIPGWIGKFLLLVLLAFGAVDLVFTRTFSAAAAAEHITQCPDPDWQRGLNQVTLAGDQWRQELSPGVRKWTDGIWNRQTVVSLIVLFIGTLTGLIFFNGYTPRFIRLAVATVVVYLALTLLIVGSAGVYLARHPELVEHWWADVWSGNWRLPGRGRPMSSWWDLLVACLPLFPTVALGLSGFELTLMAMPMVRGGKDDGPTHSRAQIRNTRWLLTTAALSMSIYLLASTLITTVLIPPGAQLIEGQARYRALAYLAHGGALADGQSATVLSPAFGLLFGVIYDVSTVAILAMAGLSFAMTLSSWIPPYLQRLGMQFNWAVRLGGLVWLFTALKFVVTVYFGADVDAHRAAYLTGVLALFAFAALAACADVWHKRKHLRWRRLFRVPPLFAFAFVIFALSAAWVAIDRPIGAVFAGAFVLLVFGVSLTTRAWRSTEFRFHGFDFADRTTELEWERLKASDFPILAPLRSGHRSLKEKEIEIRMRHRIPGTLPIVFVQAELADPSDFHHRPLLTMVHEDGRVIVRLTRCCSIAHAIAAAALELSSLGAVPEVHFGWSNENPLTANVNFVLFGHGNVPWMVYTLIRRADVPEERKPRVVIA